MRLSSRAFVLLVPVLLAGKCKDKAPDPDAISDVDAGDEINPDSELQIASVTPMKVVPDAPFDLTVYGSGFVDGAAVTLGNATPTAQQVQDANTLTLSSGGLSAGVYDLVVTNPDGGKATRRDALHVMDSVDPRLAGLDCDNLVIQFEFDASTLSEAGKTELDRHIPCFESKEGTVRIAGHADERGTTEYNLALGQRRAETIRSHLVGRSVLPSRIRTVSFGEEQPLNPDHDEKAWEENRRGEVGVNE